MKKFLDCRFRNEIDTNARNRLKWLDWYFSHGENISLTARHFGISRNTLYRWLHKFQPGALGSLKNSSTRPKQCRRRTTRLLIEQRVCELRGIHPRYGKRKVWVLLRQEGINCSMSSVGRIIKERGFPDARRKYRQTTAWSKSTVLRKRRPKGLNISKPGEYIQMDSVIIQHNGKKRAIITAIDMATRVAYAQLFSTPHSQAAWDTLKRFQMLLGTKIRAVHTDNGSEFLGVFHQNCLQNDISHTFSHPRTPKHHPHIERFNRTLQDEGIQPYHMALSTAQIKEELAAFLTNYNLFRPHEAIHDLTPIRYYMHKKFPKFSSPQLFNMYWTNTSD